MVACPCGKDEGTDASGAMPSGRLQGAKPEPPSARGHIGMGPRPPAGGVAGGQDSPSSPWLRALLWALGPMKADSMRAPRGLFIRTGRSPA